MACDAKKARYTQRPGLTAQYEFVHRQSKSGCSTLALRLAIARCICATAEFAADTTCCTAIAMEVPAVLTLRPITVKFATHAAFASGLRCRNCED